MASPVAFLGVGTDDRYPADAEEVVDAAFAATDGRGDRRTVSHLRVTGGHALDAQRFHAIIDWIVQSDLAGGRGGT